jgi:hypothetical protein
VNILTLRGWTIVDYKTGKADRGVYERQIQTYGRALTVSGGLVKGVLLEIV